MEEYTFKFKVEEINKILEGLSNLPFKESVQIIQKIQDTYNLQNESLNKKEEG